MSRSLVLVLAAGLALSLAGGVESAALAQEAAPAAGAGQDTRIPVKTADDLPRHTYTIAGKASEFLLSDGPFREFVAEVKKDTEDDLAKYRIEDPTTLQGYYQILQQIAVFDGRDADALSYIEKIRALESKESKRVMTGQVLSAYLAARASAGGDRAKLEAAFGEALGARVRALPWDLVKEEVKQAKGRAEILRKELILGSLQGQLDPVIEAQKGELSGDMVRGLVGARVTLDHLIDLQPVVARVYGAIIDENESKTEAAPDVWTPNQVTLTEADGGKPVVVAVWDSGTDVSVIPSQLYTNAKETANGKDDDGNGFVDDLHGIAWDLQSNPVPELLHPTNDLRSPLDLVTKHTKGFMDLQSNIESPEAGELKKYIGSLSADQVTPFLEDLGLYGNYSHGTHVAGIAAEGNPYVRILPARITFDFRTIPTQTPSVEQAKKDAEAARRTVEYFKAAGVRVVNMSWGGSRQGIESALEMKVPGMTPEQRAELSREIFAIGKKALEDVMKSAPDILFIAAAGNSDNDNEFSEVLPSGLSVENMITVGAIDTGGKPTSFTTFGKNVKLYANGFEVDSYVPGGKRMRFSGTSMAAPNVANLAGKILALNPGLTTQQVVELMKTGADPMPGHEGRLIINPKRTLQLVRNYKPS